MKSSHRTALSLLLTVIIFTAISLLALFGGFRYVEMHYYQPRVINNITDTLESIASAYDSYTDSLIKNFSLYALDDRTRTFIERNATETDMEAREKMTCELMESNSGLEGIRIVETDGNHVHYSTFSSDCFSKSEDLISYKNYSDLNEIPFAFISSPDNGEYSGTVDEMKNRAGLFFDSERERLIFSFPYFDKYTANRGTLIFYVEPTEFVRRIIEENIVPLNTRLKILAPEGEDFQNQSESNSGFVFGMPRVGRDVLSKSILKIWNAKRYGTEPIVQTENDDILVLISGSSRYGKIGWICRDSEFSFSKGEKVLLLLCLFITVFLLIFILFNFRHDDSVIIRERVHKFEMALFREYLEHRDTDEWKSLEKKIALRKQDVNAEIVKSLGITGKRHSKEISEALDRSWNDFMHLVSGGYRATLEKLSSQSAEPASQGSSPALEIASSTTDGLQEAVDLEEVEDLEEAVDLEEVEDLEEVGDLEDVEDLEEVEELEEVFDDSAENKNIRGNVKMSQSVSENKEDDDIEEVEEIPEDEDDFGIPAIDDFVDPLYDESDEVPPDESAQMAQAENQKRNVSSWQNKLLDEGEIHKPRYDDLDADSDDFWNDDKKS